MQIMDTRIEQVMNKQPRTCSSDSKAIDAMQASFKSFAKSAAACMPSNSSVQDGYDRASRSRYNHPYLLLMQAMEKPPRKVTFFPVVDNGELVGLVTLHKLVEAGL